MRPSAYFERLSEAYAIIDGIPDHQITLDIEQVSIAQNMVSIGKNAGRYLAPSDWDSLVLTPDIWLSLCPAYIDIVLPLLENWGSDGIEAFWRIEGRVTSRFEVAMAYLFNLTEEDAEELFGMRSDEEADSRSDKQVFLERICAYLDRQGQEVTIGTGHIDQNQMLEHGISLSETGAASSIDMADAAMPLQFENKSSEVSPMHTGFATLALESGAPGAEILDMEAVDIADSSINQEQVASPEDTP